MSDEGQQSLYADVAPAEQGTDQAPASREDHREEPREREEHQRSSPPAASSSDGYGGRPSNDGRERDRGDRDRGDRERRVEQRRDNDWDCS